MIGPIQTNCYIFFDEKSKEAMVVDPAYKDENIATFIDKNGLKVKFIYLTHCHFDHISGADWLRDRLKVPVISYHDEEKNLMDKDVNLSARMIGKPMKVKCDRVVFENDELEVGKYSFKVIHTPGHTAGSTCLYNGEILISGDTIFKNTYGRCDMPTGNQQNIINSIKSKLLNLPGNTIVYPGHGETTTIKEFSEIDL
jgi:glyoxylase-like metal-dependent hydrolase (beta-lactamase superfamily II)